MFKQFELDQDVGNGGAVTHHERTVGQGTLSFRLQNFRFQPAGTPSALPALLNF
jgi:hypothetical protein